MWCKRRKKKKILLVGERLPSPPVGERLPPTTTTVQGQALLREQRAGMWAHLSYANQPNAQSPPSSNQLSYPKPMFPLLHHPSARYQIMGDDPRAPSGAISPGLPASGLGFPPSSSCHLTKPAALHFAPAWPTFLGELWATLPFLSVALPSLWRHSVSSVN